MLHEFFASYLRVLQGCSDACCLLQIVLPGNVFEYADRHSYNSFRVTDSSFIQPVEEIGANLTEPQMLARQHFLSIDGIESKRLASFGQDVMFSAESKLRYASRARHHTPELNLRSLASRRRRTHWLIAQVDVLRVVCPHLGLKNQFAEFSMVDIFFCHECGKPVAVEERVQ